ncbi:hypothetical protein ACHAWT_005515 [Skeletonema menzelii]
MAGPGQSRGKGKALESIAARSGRDPAAIIDSIAKAEAAKQRAAKVEASKKAATAKAASKKRGSEADETTKDDNNIEVNQPSQIYSSLSPQEQYRFQCYRRSGFASKPIEKFVAKMLVDEANRRFVTRRSTMVGLGGKSFVRSGHDMNGKDAGEAAAVVTDGSDLDHNVHSTNKKRKKQSKRQMLQEESKLRRIAMDQPPPYLLEGFNNVGPGSASSSCLNSSSTQGSGIPPLDQLVVPNSASEIVAVVSTLAKCYAQRMVSAARRVADAEEEQARLDDGSLMTDAAAAAKAKPPAIAQKPISPQHLLEAHRYRSRAGLDPGFWMADRVVDVRRRKEPSSIRANVGISEAAALGTEDRTRSCFLAAIAAQDAYDEARTKEAEKDGMAQTDDDEGVKMDVDKN